MHYGVPICWCQIHTRNKCRRIRGVILHMRQLTQGFECATLSRVAWYNNNANDNDSDSDSDNDTDNNNDNNNNNNNNNNDNNNNDNNNNKLVLCSRKRYVLWIWPLCLVSIYLACRTIYVFRSLFYFYQLLQKHSIATTENYGVNMKLLYCICSNVKIDYVMDFVLEQEHGSTFTPMAQAHPLHPNRSRSRNKLPNMWVGWRVSSWWPWF